MNSFKDRISEITAFDKPSFWKQKAQDRRSKPWLRQYSSEISRRVLAILEERQDLSQVKLAEILTVSPQQMSRIVKGQENFTLETIHKLSKALDAELISFPSYKYDHLGKTIEPFMNNVSLQQALSSSANLCKMTYIESTGVVVIDLNSKANRFA
jgi:transcriptional regulator with XRE-family HTH domain